LYRHDEIAMAVNRKNPVVFTAFDKAAGFLPFSTSLSEFAWRRRLVGMTAAGLLYVDTKVPKTGYYEFYPTLLPWKDVSQVTTASTVSILGMLLGALTTFLGVCAFVAVFIRKTHVGGYGFILVALLAGPVLILGARRNLITAVTRENSYRWMSGPLGYKRTLEICAKTAACCRHNGVACASHVTQEA
jgi:hypothetical protein